MSTIVITPSLLVGTDPRNPVTPAATAADAVAVIRSGGRALVPDLDVAHETLVALGATEYEARARIVAVTTPPDNPTVLAHGQ